MHNGHIIGGEALVRWQNDKEMIYPDQFIPVLEKNGYVIDVDNLYGTKYVPVLR